MKKPIYQVILVYGGWVIGGIVALGTFLDAIVNALTIITPLITYIGSLFTLASLLLMHFFLKYKPINWVTKDGQLIRIRKLKLGIILPIIGMTILLWVPRFQGDANVNIGATATLPECVSGKIAFVAQRDGNPEIYLIDDRNGANPTNITENGNDDWAPAWSPNGKSLVFVSYRDGNAELYVMYADGSQQRRLTNTPLDEHFPAWSPDGSKIAFTYGQELQRDIYVIDANGSNRLNLTSDDKDNLAPSWSPDNNRIVFHSNREGDYDIFTMDSETGNNIIQLTTDPSEDSFPSFSPDGKRIAFVSLRSGNYEIHIMNSDGSFQRSVTNNGHHNSTPHWSPDGNRIVFTSSQDASTNNLDNRTDFEIYTISNDGTQQVRLTNNRAFDSDPSWSPECK